MLDRNADGAAYIDSLRCHCYNLCNTLEGAFHGPWNNGSVLASITFKLSNHLPVQYRVPVNMLATEWNNIIVTRDDMEQQ